jgi:hypothetical protein
MRRLTEFQKRATIICVECEKRVPLWDDMEELFSSEEVRRKVYGLRKEAVIELDNESKGRALVGDVISTASLAGQISREFAVCDHGIDMEIEFKSDDGVASGRKLYLQLKSGDSHLKQRKGDGAEIFTIKKPRHVTYWLAQAFPVFLVVRSDSGETRWMEIQGYLERELRNGARSITRIQFVGERFDVMSIRRWRDIILDGQSGHQS